MKNKNKTMNIINKAKFEKLKSINKKKEKSSKRKGKKSKSKSFALTKDERRL